MKIAILGGGMPGLLSSYVFGRHKNVKTMLFEPGELCKEFLIGGLRYTYLTDEIVELLAELNLVYSDYSLRGGILLKDTVEKYPECFKEFDKENVKRIQTDYWRKTRKTELDGYIRQSLIDPISAKPKKVVRPNYEWMISELSRNSNVIKSKIKKIDENFVVMHDNSRFGFDYLIVTIPLWEMKKYVRDWYIPSGQAMKLNTALIVTPKDRYAKWDYVYTPYTPANCIHRFTSHELGYLVEANGDLDFVDLVSDLNFLFYDGWYLNQMFKNLKGYLLPLVKKPQWPSNVVPLGRFAKWNFRITLDSTLAEIKSLERRWF